MLAAQTQKDGSWVICASSAVYSNSIWNGGLYYEHEQIRPLRDDVFFVFQAALIAATTLIKPWP